MIGVNDSFKSFLSTCLDQVLSEAELTQLNLPEGTKYMFYKWGVACKSCFFSVGEAYTLSAKEILIEESFQTNEIGRLVAYGQINSCLYLFNSLSVHLSKRILKLNQGDNYLVGFVSFILQTIEISILQLSERKVKEKKRIEFYEGDAQNELYRKLFLQINIPVIILDKELQIFDFNEPSRTLFDGLNRDELFFHSVRIDKEANQILHYQLSNLSRQKQTDLKFDTYLETLKGKRFYRVMIKKIHLPQMPFEGTMVMFDDLSHRKNIEQHLEKARKKAEESDSLKTAFLANMSHEIRTPMNAIIGFSELLVSTSPTKKEMDEYLGLIQKSGTDLLNIIEDIIDVAKIEAKQLKIKKKATKPYDIINDLYKVHTEQLSRLGCEDIELRMNIPEGTQEVHFNTDSERLKQVLVNLMTNAIKFTDKGTIEFGYKLEANNKIKFYVRDTGIGITPDAKEKIFDRFYQVEDHLERNNGGTGLGLTISKNIVKLLGGELQLDSVYNQGSLFYFQLEYDKVVETHSLLKSTKGKPKAQNTVPDFSGVTVLIAEDEETNYFFLAEILRATNIAVLHAKNGLEAINLVEQRDDIDIVLMDIKMPEVNGLEAVRYIHAIKPGIPVIAQTANAMDNDRATCIKAGCVDYLTKPIDKNLLYRLMSKFIHVSSLKVVDKTKYSV